MNEGAGVRGLDDGVGGARGGEEEALGGEDGSEVRLRGGGSVVVGRGVGEGGGVVGGRWRVRVVENGGVFELEETEVKVFGEQAGHVCFVELERERKEGLGRKICLCVPYINFFNCVFLCLFTLTNHTHTHATIHVNKYVINFFSIFFLLLTFSGSK